MTREFHSHSGADPRLAGGRLTIDISALTANYRLLSRLSGGYYTDQALVMAGTLLGTLPLVVVFIVFGRQIIGGIMQGGVKG